MNTKKFSANVLVLLLAIAGVVTPAIAEETTAVEELGNNLSFPVIPVDGFTIPVINQDAFNVHYAGEYTGLTPEDVAWLMANGDPQYGKWYPQKKEGNTWQAAILSEDSGNVTHIDWGDNIESVNPKKDCPFRLEVTLYKELGVTAKAYTMAVLEYPSSPDEVQGTNESKYDSSYATIVSSQPKLSVQFLGNSNTPPTGLAWDGALNLWRLASGVAPEPVPLSFGPELNVAGKYVFGVSQGGWKPDQLGWYRLTFYSNAQSSVNLANAKIANYLSDTNEFTETSEGTAAFPLIDTTNNLTYVDVKVTNRGGGGRGKTN